MAQSTQARQLQTLTTHKRDTINSIRLAYRPVPYCERQSQHVASLTKPADAFARFISIWSIHSLTRDPCNQTNNGRLRCRIQQDVDDLYNLSDIAQQSVIALTPFYHLSFASFARLLEYSLIQPYKYQTSGPTCREWPLSAIPPSALNPPTSAKSLRIRYCPWKMPQPPHL